jgi:hypothetical protein
MAWIGLDWHGKAGRFQRSGLALTDANGASTTGEK